MDGAQPNTGLRSQAGDKQATRSAWMNVAAAAGSFHTAWLVPELAAFMLLYAAFLLRLASSAPPRFCFYHGCAVGLLVFSPHLAWFWRIFGVVAPCLWAVLAFYTGVFVWSLNRFHRVAPRLAWLAAPVLWTGLEYFRSEVYFLKFSWLSTGYAFASAPLAPVETLGVHGLGFALFLAAGVLGVLSSKVRMPGWIAALASSVLLLNLPGAPNKERPATSLNVAGVQLEFPPDLEVSQHLDRVICAHPQTELVVLSEYTFDGEVPKKVRNWCRKNRRYLIAGGKDESPGTNYYNTAFVVGPNGEIVFRQAKSVPIQFFKDGLPARSQEVWHSPWGPIAIPVCYDLSYRRVLDRFMAKGARAIIVPFMDIEAWGEQQHKLHARVAPLRAREYQVPIFRVGSSGISQHVDRSGAVVAELPFPGQEQIIAARLALPNRASLPLDSWLGPACAWVSGATLIFLAVARFDRKRLQSHWRP